MDVKIKLPFTIDGNAIIRGQFTEVSVTHATVGEVDAHGYAWLEVEPLERHTHDSNLAPSEKLGNVSAKKLAYEVFRTSKGFQVVILGKGKTPRRVRFVDADLLIHIHRAVGAGGSTFSQIRTQAGSVIDALQLKAGLAVLEVTRFVECSREGKQVFYRRVREWSQLELLA
jgi:hypothetical protein